MFFFAELDEDIHKGSKRMEASSLDFSVQTGQRRSFMGFKPCKTRDFSHLAYLVIAVS